MEEPYYQLVLNLMPYVQLMTAVDIGLLVLENRSITVRFQKKILDLQRERYKPFLNELGTLTQKCQERWYGGNDAGRAILGLAESIRNRKKVFMEDTELEQQSAFMPALGLTSGLFCILYLLFVPFLMSSHNETWLYWLEYVGESVLVGQVAVILTFIFLPPYRGYLTSLAICGMWIVVVLLISLLLSIFGANITCGTFGLYGLIFIVIPGVPMFFYVYRLIAMLLGRSKRIAKLHHDKEMLEAKLKLYY